MSSEPTDEQAAGFDETVGEETSAAPELSGEEQLREELAMANDRALRAAAELENVRRRSREQLNNELQYAVLPLIQSLLPVFDNIDRAIEAGSESAEGESLLEGFKIVASQMQGVLAQFDCTVIEALGQPFDPNWHEAILQQPSDEYGNGIVMLVTETGYKLHDRVVRPSKVIVSTGNAQ